MKNMSLKKVPVPEQDPVVRSRNFEEVCMGYTEEMAVEEASRCLQCSHRPCTKGCPVSVNIPEFIAKVAERNFAAAYEIITATSALPAICGRVCPQETQCESQCTRGIKGEPVGIGRLERFVADWARENLKAPAKKAESNGIRVAVIGSGPSGLTCASDLSKKGYKVTVFEAFHNLGGVLIYGIPEFRLPKSIVAAEVQRLEAQGVEFRTNTIIGKLLSIDELFDYGYEAVYVGSGAGLPMFMNIEGEALSGVYSANEYLTRINLMKAYRDDYDTPMKESHSVVVVGGGNVAMDSARCARRMGAEVTIVYRRGEEDLPARAEEVHHAKEEGIKFQVLSNPKRFINDGHGCVAGVECIRMQQGEPDASGRRRPVPIEGSEFTLVADTVIVAIGTSPNPMLRINTPGLESDKKGCLIVNEETLQTSREGVFAGGDAVTGSATVIMAMGAGKKAAASIDKYLQEKKKA